MAQQVLGGADLLGANLFEASLRGADLKGAELWEASLRGADLKDSMNLCQAQLDRAWGDRDTKLPEGLTVRMCPEASTDRQSGWTFRGVETEDAAESR